MFVQNVKAESGNVKNVKCDSSLTRESSDQEFFCSDVNKSKSIFQKLSVIYNRLRNFLLVKSTTCCLSSKEEAETTASQKQHSNAITVDFLLQRGDVGDVTTYRGRGVKTLCGAEQTWLMTPPPRPPPLSTVLITV